MIIRLTIRVEQTNDAIKAKRILFYEQKFDFLFI
jgi:hypothetical protein